MDAVINLMPKWALMLTSIASIGIITWGVLRFLGRTEKSIDKLTETMVGIERTQAVQAQILKQHEEDIERHNDDIEKLKNKRTR